ncbi:MAG: glycoside hydrolase family 43 protein [Lachnospiraceae bacterium]
MRKKIAAAAVIMLLGAITGCSQNTANETTGTAGSTTAPAETEDYSYLSTDNMYEGIAVGSIKAGVSVHDPSIIQADGNYYIFGSHMSSAVSTDMRTWKYVGVGNGYNSNNTVYGDLFETDSEVFAWAGDNDGDYSVWAPHVIYNKTMEKYVMYYCTSSTYIKSSLCFGIADSIEGPYTWQSTLLYSGFTSDDIDQTDVLDYVTEEYAAANYLDAKGEYNNMAAPNCIDPTLFYDENDKLWMVYGSWSGGIFLLEIDPATGLVIHPEADEENDVDPYFGKRLLGGGHHSIEAPYIMYDEDSGYYYLYVAYGSLNREGGYQIRVFRSESPDGPYVDMLGQTPSSNVSHNFMGLKLSGNYMLPSLECAYMATGHNSAFKADDGKMYIAYHTRFDNNSEYHEPRVKQFFLNEEGWPVMLPYATNGETISETGYENEDLVGIYYFVEQGNTIDSTIAEPTKIELREDGTVVGLNSRGSVCTGTWSRTEGSYYMKLTYNNVEYSGVFCRQQDEAGTDVMTFTAAGNNISVWGVKY